ncbi:hypothetical protein [Ovoidimarina sediminis]|uniref:hypothetical protein n=1 Tax=Ovoidimarina sediminis TaxID=3079856 RepID=UPI0029118602|nr:hypothetical protein [Rhodophyticola sp. MJ-SS7]MDU8945897.1 hypothetical protein [Rhodophyticola sp. MJ-SS7]
MFRVSLLAFLLAAACAPPPESARSAQTGIERHASRVIRLDTGRGASFDARAAMVRAGRQERWVVLTSVIRSDGDGPRIAAAWSNGIRLDYRVLDHRRRACDALWSAVCLYEEKGEIRLSRAAFEAAASSGGLYLHLSGYRGSYGGHIEGAAFAEVLRRAGAAAQPSKSDDIHCQQILTTCG